MNREILEKPFGPEQIKQREGNFGKMLDYIEGHAVIQRLNDAFDADWSFNVIRHDILKETDEVIVLGELKAGNVVKTQFGSSKITRARESGEIISLADDLKAAATDALKKAATLLGVGLHLYGGNNGKAQNAGNGHYQGRPSASDGNGNRTRQSAKKTWTAMTTGMEKADCPESNTVICSNFFQAMAAPKPSLIKSALKCSGQWHSICPRRMRLP